MKIKMMTIIQAGALLLLAVFGAYASTAQAGKTPCSGSLSETVCEL